VTTADFIKPAVRNSSIANEAYAKRGVSRKPDIPCYDPINPESAKGLYYNSVAKEDYKKPQLPAGHASAKDFGLENKAYLRTHHFSFGEEAEEEDDRSRRVETLSHLEYRDPSELLKNPKLIPRKDAAGVASYSSAKNQGRFEITLDNTISRYVFLVSPLTIL
jgi:hypothetical protein